MAATTDMQTTTEASKPAKRSWQIGDEPWPIWAAILIFVSVLVISGLIWGPVGLVSVMVPTALGMVVLLLLIVRG